MRYILINDLYVAGGAEVQAIREQKIFQDHGNDVLYITIDPNLDYHESKHKNHINISRKKSKIIRLMDRYFVDRSLYNEFNKIFDDFKPDFIHLNNVYLSAPTVYKSVKKIYCLQTVRDFSIVCVNSTCTLPDRSVCEGYKNGKCFKQCYPKNIKKQIIFWGRYIALKRNEKLKKSSVNRFICPSECLTKYCLSYGYPTVCINNTFDFSLIDNFKKSIWNTKIFFYFGEVSHKKGVSDLIAAFKKFTKQHFDVELWIAGRLRDIQMGEIESENQIKYLGILKYNEIIDRLSYVYSVVVPSVWIENYPNTILEAFATDCIAIGSNRGGIPEQIETKECLFDVTNKNDILKCLEYVYGLSNEDYTKILNVQKNYLHRNNTPQIYYSRLKKEVKNVK